MRLATVASGWQTTRDRLFHSRTQLAFENRIVLCFGMAGLTGLLAQVRVPLPLSPVPVTGQVFAVLLAGVFLGKHFGAVSQALYVGLGAAGVPWFTGWSSGALFGPTGGYLLGFVAAAAFIGWFVDKRPSVRRLPRLLTLMLAATAMIHMLGAVWFAWVMRLDPTSTLRLAVVPFIPFDVAKAALAASISSAVLPQRKPRPRGNGRLR